jgi:import receptor subunit TOM70
LEKLEDAAKEFATAVNLAPEQGMTYIQKCYAEYRLAYVNQNQIALYTVMNDFQNAIAKFPQCVESYSVMAQVLTEQQQFDQADSFFDKAIKIAPNMASLYVHRGIMQLQWNGDVHKAVEYMNTAIKVDEKCELAYETLGTIEVQRGNLEKAVELFEKALKLGKSEPELVHLYALRNAAVAQINVAKKLGIDMSSLSALAGGLQ